MKITTKQYALSLYQAVQGKKQSQIKSEIENFVNILINNNDIAKADETIKQFEKIWNREQGIVEAKVVSARELDKRIVNLLKVYIVKLSSSKKVNLKQRVDKNILGGVVIKYEDKVIDGSLKTKLSELNNKMIK